MASMQHCASLIRRLVAGAVVCLLAGAFVAVAAPSRAQETEPTLGEVDLALFALLFVHEEDIVPILGSLPGMGFGWSEVPDPIAYNPFRLPVTYDMDRVDSITLEGMFAGVVNFGDTPAMLPFDPSEIISFGSDRTETAPSMREITPFDKQVVDLLTSIRLARKRLEILDDEFSNHFRVTSEGSPTGPVLMLGARTVGPRMVDCSGLIREYGVVFDTSGTNWDESTGANPQQFNDFFFNGDTAIIDRCTNGDFDSTVRQLTFQNPFSNQPFVEEAGTATMVSGDYGWMLFVPLDSVPDVTGFRLIDFVTDIMAPYNPDYTAASAAPTDLTQLIDVTSIPVLAYDPALNVPETTTTSSTTTTTSLAVAPPPEETTTTTLLAIGPIDTSTGGPMWWLILIGLGLVGLGAFFWWQNGNPLAPATTGGGGSATMTAPPPVVVPPAVGDPSTVSNGTAVLVPPPDRPGKGEGGGDDTPPKIGLRGWKI